MRTFLFLSTFCAALAANATVYYIAPDGNDANSGTSQSAAWRTIDRVNQNAYSFQAGDSILYQRGGVYRGQMDLTVSGTPEAPVTVSAFGIGAAPVISGSMLVTGWLPYSGNIWKAYLGTGLNVKYLFMDGERMTLARYPNSGWLRSDGGSYTSMTDSELSQPDGYWDGATLVIRSTNWSYDVPTITAYSQGEVNFDTNIDPIGANWGYFLRNKLSELDQPGEWYYDPVSGMLYFQAPGNVPPAGKTVEAATVEHGISVFWLRHDIVLSNLAFRHQTDASIRSSSATRLTVDGCSFADSFHAITTGGGEANTYSNCSITKVYGTAMHILGNEMHIIGNTFSNVAMVPGLGETSWGYFGIRASGNSIIIRGNHMENIGYIGIAVSMDALVEKNIVVNATATLNDGGGITFDHADGVVVQDNIVHDCIGNLESAAPSDLNYRHICMGIYFGNTGVLNTTVQRNTVYNCKGSGIHVDHTMNSTGIQVKNNVLFNNDTQLSISDYSNYNGPAAVPPYFVPNYNDVYSGNVMYSLDKDQLCMLQMASYGSQSVDFGTFTNNRYFNPYNEMSIRVIEPHVGPERLFALERWKAETGEDAGSTRSPLRLSSYTTTQELSGNLVQHGTFSTNVNGWTGWPYNAQVSWVTDRLDSGALKAYLPDNSQYYQFIMHNPDPFPIEDQAWYRVRCSLQSDTLGEVLISTKGLSTSNDPYTTWQRELPFDGERRDLEMYFQSDLTDQANIRFVNQWTEPMYYLDNVEVTKVTAEPVDPGVRNKLFVNDQASDQTFTVPEGCWKDVDGNFLPASITLAPYSSKAAYRYDGPDCNAVPTGAVRLKMMLGGTMESGSPLMRDDLHQQGLVPTTEPYSAAGYTLEDPGVSAAPAVMQATGEQAVVDWVLLELRDANSGYTVAGRRAALLLRNGTVVDPEGNVLISFDESTMDRYISVRHRNHLGAMCATMLMGMSELVDFTQASTPIFGTDAEMNVNGVMALWPGNVSGDGTVKYTGQGNDRDQILSVVGGDVPTNLVAGYANGDVNMDGVVSYTGPGNDREVVLHAIGSAMSTVVRNEQLP